MTGATNYHQETLTEKPRLQKKETTHQLNPRERKAKTNGRTAETVQVTRATNYQVEPLAEEPYKQEMPKKLQMMRER